jgi:hypothetical protein
MHIVIFNGPAGSGKDTAADHLVAEYGYTKLEMKGALRRLAHAMASLAAPNAVELCKRLEYETDPNDPTVRLKNTEVRPEFGNRTWRQFLIWISEDVCKPIFGADIFSLAAVKAIRDSNATFITFSDCGFQVEVDTIHRLLNPEATIDLAHISRPGYSFEGDSRNYVTHPGRREIEGIDNATDIAAFIKRVDLWMGYVR